MALYVIGDLHLSLGANKPMDIFGGRWSGYMEKLKDGLSVLTDEDTLVLLGDLSWAMALDESAAADFRYIAEIPGRKIIVKGNHDYWWTTRQKFDRFCDQWGIPRLEVLHNCACLYGDTALCGTRGWFYEEERGSDAHDAKMMNREILRLEASLRDAGEKEKICFLHYPPIYGDYLCRGMVEKMKEYGVNRCFYAHLHGAPSHMKAVRGTVDGISYQLVSADYLNFAPWKVMD